MSPSIFTVYFRPDSHGAQVADLAVENGKPLVRKVHSAIGYGIVVAANAAENQVKGALVDGIGNALFWAMKFANGSFNKNNFNKYRIIRGSEAPAENAGHFVDNGIDQTGHG